MDNKPGMRKLKWVNARNNDMLIEINELMKIVLQEHLVAD